VVLIHESVKTVDIMTLPNDRELPDVTPGESCFM